MNIAGPSHQSVRMAGRVPATLVLDLGAVTW